ncbi:MAG: hypothetical protein LUE92_08115, partial [Clostridiales bacterium]|nr:hypothetical protein [Clostridiales bacterium]
SSSHFRKIRSPRPRLGLEERNVNAVFAYLVVNIICADKKETYKGRFYFNIFVFRKSTSKNIEFPIEDVLV